MGFEDSKRRGQKRSVAEQEASKPPAKRPALAADSSAGPEQQERVRSNVRSLFNSYNALISRAGNALDRGAFQALLKASTGDVASQRLAARLVPRFIALFPDQVEVAAGALIKLYERYQDVEGFDKPLEEHTRRDALHGLMAVMLAASSGTPHGSQAVKLILSVLFRLLPQAEVEQPSTEEPEEEEGEVAPADSHAAAAAATGPWVRKVLRLALQHHPIPTLTFCFGCLGTSGRNSSSSSMVGPAAVQGVRLWLREHILREPSPSREGTPMDCDGSGSGGGAAAGCSAAALAAAAAAGAAGVGNGAHASSSSKAGAAAAAAAAGAAPGAAGQQRSSVLQSVLEGSAELRAWVRQEAKGMNRAPEEAKAVLQAAMQLMPPERPPTASKRPGPSSQQQPRPAPNHPLGPSRLQQQQPPYQQPYQQQPPPQQQQQPAQHKAPNGVAARPVNGMEQLGRSWSTPSPTSRGPRGRTAVGRPPEPAAAGSSWGQFPRPAGPICRLESCVLLSNVPWHMKPQDLQQQLQAVEAWVLDTRPPPAAAGGGGGSSSSTGARACCVMKAPLDAARTYMRHHKANRLGPQPPPVQVFFASSMPACSRSAAGAPPSAYVWALRAVAGDAEKVTDDLREAGLIPKSVSRVNHGSEPGTVLEAHSAQEAADILTFLLKTHAAAVAAQQQQQQQQQQQEEELPPLPPEPPPAGDWTPGGAGGGGSSRAGKPPATPAAAAAAVGAAGAGLPRQQQQQQQQGPPPIGGPSPMQQQGQGQAGGYGTPAGGFRRSNSLPLGVAGSAVPGSNQKSGGADAPPWRQGQSPGGPPTQQGNWGTPVQQQQQQQWGPGSSQQQQQQPWQQGAPPGDAAGRGGWQQGTPNTQQQQQQGRWPPSGPGPGPGGGGPQGGVPPFPGPPGGGGPQQQQLQRQHSYAGASPVGAGGTPTHAGSPAGGQVGPGQVPPSPAVQVQQQQYAGAHVLWRGGLYKSEVPVGTVCCVEPAGAARQSGTAPEPHQWPDALHINHRISVNDALEHYAAAAPHARAVRVLLPQDSPAGNVAAIQSFVQYLTSKGRAGMVKLPGANGVSPRALYLIVPRANVCQSLQVAWDGRCVMLIVVVVPQGGGGGGGGASGGGAAGGGKAPPLPAPGGPHPGGFAAPHHGAHIGHRPMR